MEQTSDINRLLFDAVRTDDQQRVDQLLESGADIEATEEEGTTPLHVAAALGHVAMTKHLIARGANINAVNDKGGTTLLLARTGYTLALKMGGKRLAAERLELVKWLRQHGAVDTPGTEPRRGCAAQAMFFVWAIAMLVYLLV